MKQKILIIDGHSVYAQKMIGFLQGLTFKNIFLAKTGAQGVQEVKIEKPDLVILSAMLSDMSSLEVCRSIREVLGSQVRIVVQFGLFTEEEEIRSFYDCGADMVTMRKERNLDLFQEIIENLLFRKKKEGLAGYY